jgi:hypothetical protein
VIGDTILGSNFLSLVDFSSNQYFNLDGSSIEVLKSGSDINLIDFNSQYNLYSFIDKSQIGDTLLGSNFDLYGSVDFNTDLYFYIDGSPLNLLTTGSDIDTIDFVLDYDSYTYLDSTSIDIFVSGIDIDTIDLVSEYMLYSFLDYSAIADTILGSDFDTLNSDNDIYAHLGGPLIDVLVTGTDIDTINFYTSYNLYWDLNDSAIAEIITGSQFDSSVDFGTDFYAHINGDTIDVVITGNDIAQISFGTDYLLYLDINGDPIHEIIPGSDFNTINLNTDFYSYEDGSIVDAVRTGSFINSINFANDYTNYLNVDFKPVVYCIHETQIAKNFGIISDISVDPTNPDNVCVVSGGTGGKHVYYSNDATSLSPNFTSKDGTTLPDMPVFGCIVELNPATNQVILGTEYGIFSTDDITASSPVWTPSNNEIGPIPVFDVTQQWRPWEDGLGSGIRRVGNPGAIYACTFGRGIWRADELLSTPEHYNFSTEEISKVKLYPNPTNENTNISFNLNKTSDVTVQVYDLTGKLVKSIYNNTKLYSGEYNLNFNVSNLELGTYIVLLQTNTEKKIAKFIKY